MDNYKTPWWKVNIYYPIYRLARKFNLRHRYGDVKNVVQRAKRGYGYQDVWGFDYHLSNVIIGGLTRLRDHHMGVPMGLGETGKIDPKTGWPKTNMKKADKEWCAILDKIIAGFQAHLTMADTWPHPDSKEGKKLKAQYDEGMKLFAEYFGNFWD